MHLLLGRWNWPRALRWVRITATSLLFFTLGPASSGDMSVPYCQSPVSKSSCLPTPFRKPLDGSGPQFPRLTNATKAHSEIVFVISPVFCADIFCGRSMHAALGASSCV